MGMASTQLAGQGLGGGTGALQEQDVVSHFLLGGGLCLLKGWFLLEKATHSPPCPPVLRGFSPRWASHAHPHVPLEASGPWTCFCLLALVTRLLYLNKILPLRKSLVLCKPASKPGASWTQAGPCL